MKYSRALVFVILLFSFGCVHYPFNAKLETFDKDAGYRIRNLSSPDNSDSLFVVLAFSGGGTRAAALSYGLLEKLRDIEISWEGRKQRLLDEIDVISGVSGGSFTAAYYALYGDGIFSDFEEKFLKKNIEFELSKKLLSPVTLFNLMSPAYDRIDLASEYYDQHIFGQKTFGDLLKKRTRPFIIINATDMSLGSRFEFTQDQFDLICSNLSALPLSRAVAASSAFPFLLSPITLKSYAGDCGFKEPAWISQALEDRDFTDRRYNLATNARSYQNIRRRPYIHLLDGGIADNIGLRGLLHALTSTDSPWSILRMINLQKIRKAVFIVVDARNDPDTKIDRSENRPSLADVLLNVATVPMENFSFETIDRLRQSVEQFRKDAQSRRDCEELLRERCSPTRTDPEKSPEVDFYTIVISFDMLKSEAEKDYFQDLPTSFHLQPETVDRIRAAAGKLLDSSDEFSRLLKDLNP